MSWRVATIEEIGKVKGGKRLPEGHQFASEPTPFPYIRARDIGGGKIEIQERVYLQEHTQKVLSHYIVRESDIVITIVGANVGDVGYISEEFDGANLTENAAKIEVNKDLVNPYFLKSFLATGQIKSRLSFIASGAAQGKLGLYKIKSFQVPIPPLTTQNRIAQLVKAYDDLIENNRRRIALLEEAARMLYREWFVHFRFPGHEHVKIIDGLPEGWERQTLIYLAEVVMGQSPESKFYNETGDGLPFHQGVTDYGFRYVTHRTYSTAVTRLGQAGDILLSVRAPVGRINLTRDNIVLGRGLSAIRSRLGYQSYLFYALKNHFYAEDIIGTGSIYAATNKKELEGQLLVVPSQVLLREFEDQASQIDRLIGYLTAQVEKLTQARDLLLPRLMNGEIVV